MKKKFILIIIIVVVSCLGIAHWYYSDRGRFTTEPEFTNLSRGVVENDLISKEDPAMVLRFDQVYQHLGGQKFILYGVADTEQHFFIEKTNDNKLQSVYWVQYEAYLPGKGYTYDYDDSPLRTILGEYEFFTDTDFVKFDPQRKRRKGTDGAMAREFLSKKGYTLPNDWAYARLVFLTDASKQKELMIIFIDDIANRGISVEEVIAGGMQSDLWREVEQAHLDRIRNTLTVLSRDD